MKFSKLSQLFLVSSIGLLVATVLTACAIITIDYVFVACSAGSGTSNDGQIQTYAVDSQSGALRTGAPAVSSGGVNPVAMAVTSDYANLYVANAGNSTIVHFAIALNGVLTSKDTVTAQHYSHFHSSEYRRDLPVCDFLDALNHVAMHLRLRTLTEYALSSGTIGSVASSVPLNLANVSSTYASDAIVPTGDHRAGQQQCCERQSRFCFGLRPIGLQSRWNHHQHRQSRLGLWFHHRLGRRIDRGHHRQPLSPTAPGRQASSPRPSPPIPTDRFVYVTDYASNELIGYTILDGSTLSFLPNGPFRTGNEPSAVAIDPRGMFIYVANSLDNTVSPYAINLATGTPTGAVNPAGGSAISNATDTEPVAVMVDPALGRFVYTANYLGNSVSGFRLDPISGGISATQATPYPTGSKPTAVTGVPHGNYSTQSVTP